MKYGQVRKVDRESVLRHIDGLSTNPPVTLIRLCVWQEPSMNACLMCFASPSLKSFFRIYEQALFQNMGVFCLLSHTSGTQLYFILSGQHIFSAATEVADSLSRRNRPVPKCVPFPWTLVFLLNRLYRVLMKCPFTSGPSWSSPVWWPRRN